MTQPEDMRYAIVMAPMPGEEQERQVHWLAVVLEECTLDCLAPGNPAGVHRPGCGLELLAPVFELRAAWQRAQHWDQLVAKGTAWMNEEPEGARVRAVAGDTREVRFEGHANGVADFPTLVVRLADGSRRFWSLALVERVAGEEPV